MKSFIVVALFAAVCLGLVQAEDQLFGVVGATDLLIAREVIKKPFMLGMVQTATWSFVQPATGGPYTINAIKVLDEKKMRGATAAITSGALASQAITLTLTSKRGAGIKSVIEVYGTA